MNMCVCVCVRPLCANPVTTESLFNGCQWYTRVSVCARALYILYYNKRLKEMSQWVVGGVGEGSPGGGG